AGRGAVVTAETGVEYPRFRWLEPGRIAGAPHPDLTGGLGALAPFLERNGAAAIVSVCGKPPAADPASPGCRYPFVEPADLRPRADLASVLDFIDAEIAASRGVVVHCFAGIGRTGTVLTAWLLRHHPDLTAAAAIAFVRDAYVPDYARDRFPEHPAQAEA